MQKKEGAYLGTLVGDALAMPVHWYYDRAALYRDYGQVKDYLKPKNPHPNSILWRSHYKAPNPKGEILHGQAVYWGKREVHYHQFLEAGETTLTGQLVQLHRHCLEQDQDFRSAYIDYLTTPGRHQDTYLEECHRNFFHNYAEGKAPDQCAKPEKHIGGLPHLVPALVHFDSPEKARQQALARLRLTHPGPRMEGAANLLIDLLQGLFEGSSLDQLMEERFGRQDHPLLGHPLKAWMALPDEQVVGPRLSTACYVEDSVPATLYLAWKYHDDPEKALIVNTNLGGDNVHRGAVLGALMGAAHGVEGFPERWRDGLKALSFETRSRGGVA